MRDVLAPCDVAGNKEKENEEATQSHHDAECPEANGDIRHDLVGRLHVAIAEVSDIVYQGLTCGHVFLPRTVLLQCQDCLTSALHLLGHGRLSGPVCLRVTDDNVVHTGHIAVEVACGQERECLGNTYLERWFLSILIIWLPER